MKEKDEFYIGWKKKMPKKNKGFIKKIIVSLFILIPFFVFVIVALQKPFNMFHFDYGKTSNITGVYYNSPVPMLIADAGSIAGTLSRDIVLVGYGKFGAKGIIKSMEEESGSLDGKRLTLEGTLIYGDGKTLLELTEKEGSLIEVLGDSKTSKVTEQLKKGTSLSGEIIDPKCYFGVMKPGEGKIHKSCAIRCISGGVPPVLKTKNEQLENRYYLLLDKVGKPINHQVLPYVAEQVTISGETNRSFSWDVLYIDVEDINVE